MADNRMSTIYRNYTKAIESERYLDAVMLLEELTDKELLTLRKMINAESS